MKNLANIETENLEKLPKQRPMHRHYAENAKVCTCIRCYEKQGSSFSYNRVYRFLRSKVGQSWARVSSDWTHADWLSPQHREYHKLTEFVETHTFIQNGRIRFYDRYNHQAWPDYRSDYRYIDEQHQDTFFVDPKTKILKFHRGLPFSVWKKRKKVYDNATFRILEDYRQLILLHGVWYEVWADKRHPYLRSYPKSYRLIKETLEGLVLFGEDPSIFDSILYLSKRPRVFKRKLSHIELRSYNLKNGLIKF